MNPSLLRTGLVLAGSLRRPPLRILDDSIVRMRVWPSDMDLNVHMNNGRYLTLMDLGRLDLLVRTGIWRAVMRHGWRPVVGSATLRFRRSLPLWAGYELHTRLACWDHKWFFMEQRFIRDGLSYGVGHIKGLLRDGVRNVGPDEVLEAIGRSQPSPPVPTGIEHWLAAEAKLTETDRAYRQRR